MINITLPPDDICKDAEAVQTKEKVMHKQRLNALFYSTSDTFKFLAAVTLAASMALVGGLLKAGTITTAGSAIAAISASPVALTFLGTAALFTAIAITSNFISNHYFHSANYDSLEVNAQHTAKYLSEEISADLKKDNLCLTNGQSGQCRADGKSWVDVANAQKQQQVGAGRV